MTAETDRYLLVVGTQGWLAAELSDSDHHAWLQGPLNVYHRTEEGQLFELATCDPFCYPGCWEWAPVPGSAK